MKPLQIKVLDKVSLAIKWNEKSESNIGLKYLRDECPCANCKGETILLKTYRPPKPTMLNPEMYNIQNIQSFILHIWLLYNFFVLNIF